MEQTVSEHVFIDDGQPGASVGVAVGAVDPVLVLGVGVAVGAADDFTQQ